MEAAGRPRFGALLRQFRLDAGMTQHSGDLVGSYVSTGNVHGFLATRR